MKLSLILLPLLALTACNTKEADPIATTGNINAQAPYIWASNSLPRNLRISEAFSNAEVSNIQAMAGAWETAVQNKRDFFVYTERTPEISSINLNLDSLGDDNINGVYKITRWPLSLSSSALAVTQIFGRRFNIGSSNEYVRIEHADILINENIYDFRTDDSTSGWSYDLRTVVLHELGHFLGLGHKYGNTVMVPAIGTNTVIRAPSSVDASDIATKYNVTLGTGSAHAMVIGTIPTYVPNAGDSGEQVKILIELTADGECIHKENGTVISRHSLMR